jgi:exosortase B
MTSSFPHYFSGSNPYLKNTLPEFWPILLGMIVLYAPTFYELLNGIWATEAQMHGPIIFVLSIWIISRQWQTMLNKRKPTPSFAFIAWIFFAIALLFYIVGNSQQIMLLELGSLILMLVAIILIKFGSRSLLVMWFPLFFMLFMIPLPGTLMTMLTMPLKILVSSITETILFWADYPVARNGVILQIGQYQLLVADACAGLQTLFTLEALGLFYLNIMQHTSMFRNVMLATLIVPISLAANVIRVLSLTLITYYFGEAAGQGFLHEFAGMVLFLSALILILSIDNLLQFIITLRNPNKARPV